MNLTLKDITTNTDGTYKATLCFNGEPIVRIDTRESRNNNTYEGKDEMLYIISLYVATLCPDTVDLCARSQNYNIDTYCDMLYKKELLRVKNKDFKTKYILRFNNPKTDVIGFGNNRGLSLSAIGLYVVLKLKIEDHTKEFTEDFVLALAFKNTYTEPELSSALEELINHQDLVVVTTYDA